MRRWLPQGCGKCRLWISNPPPGGERKFNARAAPGTPEARRKAEGPGARQRTLPDAENCGGEVSFRTSLPSHHSITSSARASSVGGNSRPRVLVARFNQFERI